MDDQPGAALRQTYYGIAFAEEFMNVITLAAIDFGWFEDDLYQVELSEIPDFQDVLDQKDPDQWMREKIADTETRYATLVIDLINDDPGRFELLETTAYSFGEHYSVGNINDAALAFERISVMLLDGMPEDRAMQVLEVSPGQTEWRLAKDLHGLYWEAAGGEREYFYILREKMMEGLVAGSGLLLSRQGAGHYRLIRK